MGLGRIIFWRGLFEVLQKLQIHVTHKHFYSPIPDTAELASRKNLWEDESKMPGVRFDVEPSLRFLHTVVPRYLGECQFPLYATTDPPHEYFIRNGAFGLVSAVLLHCFLRYFKPERMIEIGSGASTRVAARASQLNASEGSPMQLVSIDPFADEVVRAGVPGLHAVVDQPVESLNCSFFEGLGGGDILFVDSSHVVRTGGDVNFIYLELLPRLADGVIVHCHDIFLPAEYPKQQVISTRFFWSEQYLLQALLTGNSSFAPLIWGSYVCCHYRHELLEAIPPPGGMDVTHDYFTSSLWMRRSASTAF